MSVTSSRPGSPLDKPVVLFCTTLYGPSLAVCVEIACERADRLKVLLVEDDDLAAEKYGRALGLSRFNVVTVSNADAALRKIAADPADVVLIDLRLPPVALVELVRQVRAREHGCHTNVAILTGDYYSFQVTLEEELKTLNASLFYKPLVPEQLVLITRTLADRER